MALASAVLAIAAGAIIIVATRSIWFIGAAQLLIGIGDTSIAPILAAIKLGIVGPTVFAERISRKKFLITRAMPPNALLTALFGYASAWATWLWQPSWSSRCALF